MHGFYSRAELEQIANHILGLRIDGRPNQTVYEQSTIQNFRLGTGRRENGRLFRYGYTLTGLPAISPTGANVLAIDSHYHPLHTGGTPAGCMGDLRNGAVARTIAIPIGQRYLDIQDTELRAVNFYQGGFIVVYDETPHWHEHVIVASEEGTGTYVRLWLDHPIAVAEIPLYKAGDGARVDACAYRSPYSALAEAGSVNPGYESFVGVPLCGVVPALRFIWLMTAGPIWISPLPPQPGGVAEDRDVYAQPDGLISSVTTVGFQRVGYVMGTQETGSGDSKIMLQLDQ